MNSISINQKIQKYTYKCKYGKNASYNLYKKKLDNYLEQLGGGKTENLAELELQQRVNELEQQLKEEGMLPTPEEIVQTKQNLKMLEDETQREKKKVVSELVALGQKGQEIQRKKENISFNPNRYENLDLIHEDILKLDMEENLVGRLITLTHERQDQIRKEQEILEKENKLEKILERNARENQQKIKVEQDKRTNEKKELTDYLNEQRDLKIKRMQKEQNVPDDKLNGLTKEQQLKMLEEGQVGEDY
jgi:hypothetical protein